MKLLPIAQRSVDFLMGQPNPYLMSMDVTMRCNSKCRFCNIWRNPQLQDEIDIENSAKDIMERRLEEAWNIGCRAVCFAGGEPTLYSNLERLILKASALGYYITIITNGINLTKPEPWMKKINVLALSFTMNREIYEKTRGIPVFDRVKENIAKLAEYGLKIVLFDALSKDTLPYVDETAKFAHDLGIKLHIFSVTEQSRMGYEAIDWNSQRPGNVYLEMDRIKRKWGRGVILWRGGEKMLAGISLNDSFRCRIAETTVTVKPNGSVVLPCPAYPEYYSKPEESLVEFWHSVNASSARKLCGKFNFCEGCAHQFCNYYASLLGQPRQALRWFVEYF